ncbi:MAG: glutathione S-transferase [Rubricella sp.]
MHMYDNPASPYCRKVRLLLQEAGAADKVTMIPAAGNAVDPGTMPVGVNPLGKIPCLVRPEGPALYDSRVICAYLDEVFHARLYPTGPARWDALTLEATGDGIMDAAILMVYEIRTRPEALRSEAWREGQWAKIERALDALEARWIPMLTGPITIGHLSVAAALGYIGFRLADRDWRGTRPQLAAWFEGFSARPSMQATKPE